MAKKINTKDLIDHDDNDEVRPNLDLSKPLDVQANDRTFGTPDLPDTARQISKPVPLGSITPDPAQPRREVPFTVRKRAKEDGAPEWETWHAMAERLGGKVIPLNTLLRGEGEANEDEKTGRPLVDGFLSLVALAASINRDGLANAITVIRRGERYIIETGERRFQAYSLLYGALREEKFAKIPARVVDKSDVWRQAAENGSRKPLNAIGMARQLALLIMELNKGRDGISYAPFESFEGDCDRDFYAQVANGNVHRIPKGSSERILQTTGLKSYSQLAQYRALLSIPDEVWMLADEEDWPEGRIREHVKPHDTFTVVKVSPSTTPTPPHALNQTVVRKMRYFGKIVGYIRTDDDGTARIQLYDSAGDPSFQQSVPVASLKDLTPPASAPSPFSRENHPTISNAIKQDAGLIGQPSQSPKIIVGQIYRHRTGIRRYEVVGLRGDSVSCYEVNGAGKHITPAPFPMKIANLDEATPPRPDLMDQRVFHHMGAYRHEGVVTTIAWDQGAGDYFVKIRTDEGKIEGPFLSKNVRVMSDQPALPESPDSTIRQHLVTGLLYKIINPIPGGWARVVEVDATGEQVTGEIDALRLTDLKPYAGGTGDQWLKPGAKVAYDDGEQFFTGTLVSGPGSSAKGWVRIDIDGKKSSDKLYNPEYLRLADELDQLETEAQASEVEEDSHVVDTPLPDWAWPGRLVVEVEREHAGVPLRAHMNSETRVWMIQVNFGHHESTLPIDLLRPRTNEPVPGLPEWAYTGNTVQDAHTNPMTIVFVSWDNSANTWRLTVRDSDGMLWDGQIDIYGPLFESDAPAPRERHPALHPSNMNGVICQEQHHLGVLGAMARKLEMDDHSKVIMGMQTMTAHGIKTRLRDGDREQVQAWIDTLHAGGMGVLEQMAAHLNTLYAQASDVLADLDDEMRGQ